jgi:hypothetical protein
MRKVIPTRIYKMNDNNAIEYVTLLDEAAIKALSYNTVAYEVVLKDIEEKENKNRIAFENNEGLEEITRISEKYYGCGLSGNRQCFEECFGFDIVDTFRDMSKNPYAYDSSENLSLRDARPGIRVCEHDDEHLWYDIKKKTRHSNKDGEGYKREEYYERVPLSKSALKRKIVLNTLFPQTESVCVKDKRFPIYPLVSIILCLAILIIPIYLSILNNEVNTVNKEYDAYIRELKDEITVLNEELCKKNDMVLINKLAREEYGMIDVELSNTHLMAPSSDEIVLNEVGSEEETNIFVSLLNALGIFFDQ